MRRLGTLFLVGVLALMCCVTPAAAGRVWCKADPVIKVDGQVVDVLVSSSIEMRTAQTGPIVIVITVPLGTSAGVYATDNGFGAGYAITIQQSSSIKTTTTTTSIQVAVFAPATNSTLPVTVKVTPRSVGPVHAASAEGRANRWVIVTTP